MVRSVLSLAVVFALVTGGVAAAQSQGKGAAAGSGSAAAGSASKTQASRAFLHGYNLPASGVALDGYCPVCYIAKNKAVKGTPQIAAEYNGVTYWFVSDAARQAFLATPTKFLPAYGGWCAVGLASDKNFPVDPTNFKIVNGRILLFLKNKNVDALALWNQGDERSQLAAADAAWARRQK